MKCICEKGTLKTKVVFKLSFSPLPKIIVIIKSTIMLRNWFRMGLWTNNLFKLDLIWKKIIKYIRVCKFPISCNIRQRSNNLFTRPYLLALIRWCILMWLDQACVIIPDTDPSMTALNTIMADNCKIMERWLV